jgi:hypothetical protein
MATYEQPNYLKNNQFIPTFNSLNFSEPNDNPSSGGDVNLSDLDNRYLKKISDDTTTYNLTSTGTVTANNISVNNNISCNNISFNSTSYKVVRYSGGTINYDGDKPVYLKVAITLEPNINWLVSYVGTTIFLYQTSPVSLFLSTVDDSQRLTYPDWSTIVKNASIPLSVVTMKGSGTGGILTYFNPANQFLMNISTTTTYYLYGV